MQKRIDWIALGQHLRQAGVNSPQAAVLCGSSQPVIHKILKGHTQNPSFPLGQALIDLFKKRCPDLVVPEMPLTEAAAPPLRPTLFAPPALACSTLAAPE